MRKLTEEDRFWKYTSHQASGCWLWTGTITRHGYGQFHRRSQAPHVTGKSIPAHRYSYELLVGPIPEGLQLDHLCRVRACVNPAHLEPVTNRENQMRGIAARGHLCRSGRHDMRETRVVNSKGRMWCSECRREYKARVYRERRALATTTPDATEVATEEARHG